MIYAAEILNSRFIKIGYTRSQNIEQRIAELQTGSPYEISILFSVEGSLRQEKSIHSALDVAFARCGIPIPPNEWYPGRHPIMQEFLGHLKYCPISAISFCESYNNNVKQPSQSRGGKIRPLRKEWPKK